MAVVYVSRRPSLVFMRRALAALVLSMLALTGCSDDEVNPASAFRVQNDARPSATFAPATIVTGTGIDPTGVTDSTTAIQAKIDAAADGSTVLFPPGEYLISSALTITNRTGIILDGGGRATILMDSTASAFSAFSPSGTVSDVTVQGFTITGSGVLADGHSGFGNASGAVLKNIRVLNNTVTDVLTGISANADLAGSIDGFLIQGNTIERAVGKDPGQGYGIHHASGDYTAVANVRIIGNTLIDCGRHSIYQAKGRGVVIANNTIRNHRLTVSAIETGAIRSALVVSRSVDVNVTGNVVLDSYGGAFMLGAVAGGTYSERINIVGNIFDGALDAPAVVTLGSQSPSTEGTVNTVRFAGNLCERDNSLGVCLTLLSGINVDISDNTFDITATTFIQALSITAADESAGTAIYTDHLNVSQNRFITRGTAVARAIRLNKETSAFRFTVRDNLHVQLSSGGGLFWVVSVSVTNPNIVVSRNSTGGLSMSAGVTLLTEEGERCR